MTWSSGSGNCWTRTDGIWEPVQQKGVVAGCIPGLVKDCTTPQPACNSDHGVWTGKCYNKSTSKCIDGYEEDNLVMCKGTGELCCITEWGSCSAEFWDGKCQMAALCEKNDKYKAVGKVCSDHFPKGVECCIPKAPSPRETMIQRAQKWVVCTVPV